MRLGPSWASVGVGVGVVRGAVLLLLAAWAKYEINLLTYRLWRRRTRGRAPEWCHDLVESFARNDLLLAFEASRSDGGSFVAEAPTLAPPDHLRLGHISFAGGGFRTISYLGQLLYLERRGYIRQGETEFWGASFGAMFATGLVLSETQRHVSDEIMERIMCYLESVHDNWWGMWGICGEYSRDLLQDTLPDDVSVVNGRVHIAITVLLPYPHTVLVSDFASKQDLIDALLASQFIPGWTDGLLPCAFWRGLPCVDGGLFENVPLPKNRSDGPKLQRGGLASLMETFKKPTLERGCFICRDAHAPISQVLKPPSAEAAEHAVVSEIQRGYIDAMEAVRAEKVRALMEEQPRR